MKPEQGATLRRVAILSLSLNFILLVTKLLAGILANSTAMVADGVHSASDTLATVAVLIGIRVAQRPADETHPYGHAKAEAVAAKMVAVILTLTGFGLAWESFHLLREGRAAFPGMAAVWVGVGAIGIKLVLYRYAKGIARRLKSSALDADAENHKSDLLSTSAALAGIIGARLGYPLLDPLAGIIVGALILKMAYAIYKRSVLELMDSAPDQEISQKIRSTAQNTEGVIMVQDSKARIHGPAILVDMRLCVDGNISVFSGHNIAQAVVENIHRAETGVSNVLVHVNPCEISYHERDCTGCHPESSPMLLD